jgi:hypothetical protein
MIDKKHFKKDHFLVFEIQKYYQSNNSGWFEINDPNEIDALKDSCIKLTYCRTCLGSLINVPPKSSPVGL